VAGTRADAVACLRRFREEDAGRVQILFPDRFAVGAEASGGDGVIGAASGLIECDESVTDHLHAYLRGVVVVEDLDAAERLMESGTAARVATLDGVFFDGPGRIIVAGADDIEMTILEYESKLEELEASLSEAEERERRFELRSDELARERDGIQREISHIRTALVQEERQYESLVASRRDAELHLVRVKEKITSLEEAIAETRTAIRQFRERLEAAHAVAGGDASAEALADADLAALEERVLMLERDKESVAEVTGRLRLEEVTLAGEVVTADTKIRNIEKIGEELRSLVRAREEDAARCREQIALSEEDVVGLRASIEELHKEKDAVERDIESTGETYGALKVRRDELEKELKGIKDQRDARRENLERVSVETATLEARISGLVDKARDTFGQDLEPYLGGAAQLDAAQWEGFNREELEDIKGQLETFGPVNMLALEEHDEKKERFDFLTRQKDDLEEAKNSLVQAIRRINREARRLLNETFEQVRENFKQTFLTLFDGGEVDLMFVDSDDPLEANIKIVANPKGKRLHDISSLSSGERALVALSLLFGIYLVKPSPFCVFDEVDAPLDDANIARFVRLLKSFTDHTQFIVITHNKKTMEAADNLYGVTMEEPGVSKLISIHLDEAERFKHTGQTRAGVQAQGAPAGA
jgi:chromosome segregation protein